MDKDLAKTIIDAAKPIIEPAYNDIAKPIVKPTAELAALLPRAIKAALLPFEKWIITKEHNKNEFIKLLENELKDLPPEKIDVPEAYVATPLLQALNYSMDSNDLRSMYARLLAKSMFSDNKKDVHPAYIKIIEQLCPDEAKILKYFNDTGCDYGQNMMFSAQIVLDNQPYIIDFSDLGIKAGCDKPYDILSYIDNLTRLGLITFIESTSLKKESVVLNDKKLKEFIEVRLLLVIAQLISDDKITATIAATAIDDCKNGDRLAYECYCKGFFEPTNLYLSFASSAIDPIKSSN